MNIETRMAPQIRNVVRPAVSIQHGLVQFAMRQLQPRGILVVEVGERALLEIDANRRRLILVGIQPVLAQVVQFLRGLRDGAFLGDLRHTASADRCRRCERSDEGFGRSLNGSTTAVGVPVDDPRIKIESTDLPHHLSVELINSAKSIRSASLPFNPHTSTTPALCT